MFFSVFLLRFAGFPEFGTIGFVFYTFLRRTYRCAYSFSDVIFLKCSYLTSK
jgi:hypothetical protein